MRRQKNSFVIFFFLIFLSNPLASQEFISIYYKSFLDNIRSNHPLARVATNYADIAAYQLKAARGNYDPLIQSGIENKYYSATNYYTLAQGSIKQPIFTSQYLKAGYEFANGNYLDPEHTLPNSGLPYVGIEASLLQGLMFDKRRADVLKSKGYATFYNAEQKLEMNELLFNSSLIYFDYLYSKKVISLYNYFLTLADTRLRGIEALANIGEKPFVDTIEAAIFSQTRILDLQSAEIELRKQRVELGKLIWTEEQLPTTSQITVLTKDSLDDSYERAKEILLRKLADDSLHNPLIIQYKAKQSILEVEKRLKKEMIKPKLDVSYNFLAANQAINSPAISLNNYKWGATLSFPLLLRNSRNEFKLASIQYNNNAFNLKYKENEIELKQEFFRQSTQVLVEQLLNAERSAKYSKLLVEAERLKFENGESSLFMLNTRESKWLEAELKYADYKLKFIKTLLNIIHLNGNLNYDF